jgi:alkylation response protein AidB-like acyl-CoA dehydrogenase
MTSPLVRQWLEAGELELPLPASGDTATRWFKLAELTAVDVVAGRLAEAHTDAVAILAELAGPPAQPRQLWGVWAAEAPGHTLTVTHHGKAFRLNGTKPWCSGASLCSHALVTARGPDGVRGLFAVELAHPGVAAQASSWRNAGMADSDTRSVRFDDVPATPVGAPGDYLDRPGFWHGAIGVAACWLGGARAVAAPLYRSVADHNGKAADPHAQAHLGAVDAALAAAEAVLTCAAEFVDAEPASGRTELMARRVRAVAETAVDEAIVRTGRALGPAPLALDADHARRVADLTMYVRQSHAERDLAALGRLACAPASEVAVV